MTMETANFDYLEPIPFRSGLVIIVVSTFFFQCLCHFVGSVGLQPSKDDKETWKSRNIVISWLHAVMVTSWNIACFYYYWNEILQDPIAYHNMFVYTMVAFSTGYFFYDYFDIVVNIGHSAMWEVLMHHYMVIGIFIYNLVQCRYVCYSAIALLVEVNSVFLHLRKLLQMAHVSYKSIIYRINSILNLWSFLVFRFGAVGAIIVGMFVFSERFSTLYMWFLGIVMLAMVIINGILFWRLLRRDVLGKSSGQNKLEQKSKN